MRVAWTGFGQFQGVEANPSAVLAQRLAAQHSTEGDSVEILEVSAAAAKAWRCPDAGLVIHVGVAITYDAITLERCAYNDASFRVPDQNAFQPSKAPIDDSELFGSTRKSSLDLAAVAQKAGVNLSDDAGRFVAMRRPVVRRRGDGVAARIILSTPSRRRIDRRTPREDAPRAGVQLPLLLLPRQRRALRLRPRASRRARAARGPGGDAVAAKGLPGRGGG